MTVPLWIRPDHNDAGRTAQIILIAFSTEPLAAEVPLSASEFGIPSEEAAAPLDVRTHARADDPEWFDGWVTGALRRGAEKELTEPDRLDRATHCHTIAASVDDPPDLGVLQAAWAVARWLVARGCFALLDGGCARWMDGTALTALAPDRPFDFDAEVSFVFETDATGDLGHLLHTRGMAKFARPDLLTFADPADVQIHYQVLHTIAITLAEGTVMRPDQLIRFDGEHAFGLVAYEPDGNAPDVGLNNDGLLVVPAE
jgi:hypothetical protein